jgi:hypothetical protein
MQVFISPEYIRTIESARARYGLSAMLPNLLESSFEWA